MNKFWSVGMLVSGLFLGMVVNVYTRHKQFYPTCLHISQSKSGYTLLVAFGLYLVMLIGLGTKTVFLGSLRAIEIEHLYENAWYSLTEMLLEMTIFRDEFGVLFVTLFAIYIYAKVFHWMAKDRLEYMDQAPLLPFSFHVRLVSLFLFLFVIDAWLLFFSITRILVSGPSIMILFAFEAGLLLVNIISCALKYTINMVQRGSQTQWEQRSTFLFYVELSEDVTKLCLYFCFFFMIVNFYALPLYIMRDMYLTFKSVVIKIRDWVQYRRATREIEERYPMATDEELRNSDQICIICRDEMTEAKKLNCGHLFHFQCLRSWLERQQSCPTCRRSVFEDPTPAPTSTSQEQDSGEYLGEGGDHVVSSATPIVIIDDHDYTPVDVLSLDDLEGLELDELERIEGDVRQKTIARIQMLSRLNTQVARIIDTYSRFLRADPRAANTE